MPRADTATTAAAWARDRAIDVWAMCASDVPLIGVNVLAEALAEPLRDGARLGVVAASPATDWPTSDLPVAWEARGAAAPSPEGLLALVVMSGLLDVRRLGVLAATPEAVEAAHRAGAGAIVGLCTGAVTADELAAASPDVIVTIAELAELDRQRYGTERERRRLVLLNPGPAVTSERVHRAVSGPDACHRESEIGALLKRLRSALRRVAGVGDDWSVILLTGSGTAAMEAMVGGAVRPGRRLLVCRNGIYGDRLAAIASRLGIEAVTVSAPHVEPIAPAAVEAALATDPTIDAVAVVHHETTTGLLNPIHEIAAVAEARGVPVLVDAISSFGAEELRPGGGIAWIAGTANKCLHGLPGLAFILASSIAVERIRSIPPRSLYLDLGVYLDAEAAGSVPFTPAIPAAYALEAALAELEEVGLASRPAEYLARMAVLDRGLARLGLEPVVPEPHRSSSIRCLPLPAGVAYEPLHDALKAEGYVIYAGLGEAAHSTFRICALGNLDLPALEGALEVLATTVGRQTDRGSAG